MRKALVAPSVGMATAPSVPASGRSILDDGGGGSGSGGGGGGGDDDDDDDDAQILPYARQQAGYGNSPDFRSRFARDHSVPRDSPSRVRTVRVYEHHGVPLRWQRHAAKQC